MMRILIYSLCLIVLVSAISCEKKEESTNISPILTLSSTNSFIYTDTALSAGTEYRIKVIGTSNGGANITNLEISMNDANVLNYGLNAPTLEKETSLTKSNGETDTVRIVLRNRDGLSDSKTLIISKSEGGYREIWSFENVTLQAQGNPNIVSFLDVETGETYSQEAAFSNQDLIDMLYFYNTEDSNCLSSPGGNLTGVYSGSTSPENWTTKNTTTYSRSTLSISDSEFMACNNDSLLIAHLFSDGGRKAKALQANQFWAFKTQSGKYGILKINAVSGLAQGEVNISYKVQK